MVVTMMQQPHTPSTMAPTSTEPSLSHPVGPVTPTAAAIPSVETTARQLARVRLSDITPYDGAPGAPYLRAVEALSGSLVRHNAAVIELGSDDTALMRCGLEAARLYFRSRPQSAGKGNRGVYIYRAGRALEDWDSSPPCMADIFRCMGKAARVALSAVARHLRLKSNIYNHLLDDNPLPCNEVSSSVLAAAYSLSSFQNGKGAVLGGKQTISGEVEKGLLTLISSDAHGLQVCDPNGHWYVADSGFGIGDLLLITGRALTHATAGLCHAPSYRVSPDYPSGISTAGRTSLTFRLMPQSNAILDCSPVAAAGHVIDQSYAPVSVSQFMDDLSAEDDVLCSPPETIVARDNLTKDPSNLTKDPSNLTKDPSNLTKDPSLRSVLSDPISGAFLEDAMVVSCGHSFGGLMLRRVLEMSRCGLCNAEIDRGSLIPNLALRSAAVAVKHEDDRKLFHNAAIRRRRKELGDRLDPIRRLNKENGEMAADDILSKGMHYPFSVNEKVIIRGNRRTAEKFVGKEAIVRSQCLNGWYLLKMIESGENIRLQYRSLRKIGNSNSVDDRDTSQPSQNSSS